MEYIKLTKENLEKEHICCAISGNNDPQVVSKKAWLNDRLDEGLVFLKSETRGKCFIEYIPAEYAWFPVSAKDYMFINCFWVSGSLKGHGYANDLLTTCIDDSKNKGKKGICVISSPVKKTFLSDPQYLQYKGFSVADSAEPYYTLLYLPFDKNAEKPQFKPQAKHPKIDEKGFVLYYTHACPYTAIYVPLVAKLAEDNGVSMKTILLDTREAAQNAPVVWTNYALFKNGKYITHEIQSATKFLKLIKE